MTILTGRRLLLGLAVIAGLLGCKRKPEQLGQASAPQKIADACVAGLRCVGPTSAMACVQGAQKQIECRGPEGCGQASGRASCDNALARTGDLCDEEHDFACALDRKAALECQGGQFRVVDAYDRIEGCSLKGDEISCAKSAEPSCDDIEDIACCLSFARRPKTR